MDPMDDLYRRIEPHQESTTEYKAEVYDQIVTKLDDEQVRGLFDDLNEEAEHHPPHTRQLYLALYRRLHG